MQSAYNIWQIFNKFALNKQIDPIDPCVKVSEYQFGFFPNCGIRMDRQTDMVKLIWAFLQFVAANALSQHIVKNGGTTLLT
jgi:hypothetical protein